ncbi:PRC-barrel domain containing protein [Kaistella flava (ex Peng et al. 2021)]|uniref:PRC-barrel domain containing protein n=1 Tax=Kaistella flava (ex Peng et al. 2021) TaxID=2038776 RepID=A0A7M2YC31_9FLAO|nr:PRC-barrel domain-containing protein [Kaistella flava (ex Peng et al. 2021)]QOW11827.1 PRC-barrel domain containing protein [Kaistella flava (ex Peng et al. 2021)]
MQHNIKSLIGYRMEATDGDIGKVEDFYFEDTTWLIRYLIVETGNWLLNRKVLIAPQAIKVNNSKPGIFPINLTKEQIKSSPDIDTDMPVSEQEAIKQYEHFGWQWYGTGFYAGGSEATPYINPIIDERMREDENTDKKNEVDLHLRSTKEIMGYHIHSDDGDFGHVTDFILDDKNWQILYLVVDTHEWFGGIKVLIEISKVQEIQWQKSKVIINISTEEIKASPVFDESKFKHN